MVAQTPSPAPPTFCAQAAASVRDARDALLLAWRASPRIALGVAALFAIDASLPPLGLATLRLVLDRAALDLGAAAPGAIDPLAARLPLQTLVLLTAATLALSRLISPIAQALQSLAAERITSHVTEELIRVTGRWPGIARFEDPAFADDLAHARTHVIRAGAGIVRAGATAAVGLLTIALLIALLAGLHPLAPFLLVAAAVPYVACRFDFDARTSTLLYRRTAETRRLEYTREVLLSPDAAKDVRLYRLGPFFVAQYDSIVRAALAAFDALRLRLSLHLALSSVLAGAAVGAVYVWIVWLVAHGQRTVGELALYGGAALLLYERIAALHYSIGELRADLFFLPSLRRVLDAPPDLPLAAPGLPAPYPMRSGIAFHHVSFTYAGQPTPTLRDVSFTIRPAECVALVGHNGAGKTTLVKLLLRLYDPTEGHITLDGIDLRDYDLDSLRREMAVVFQDFVRYELTAAENIGLGRADLLHPAGDRPAPDDVRPHLLAAAARGGATGLVDSLPHGIHTPVGRLFGGRDLSGGEWQKLALARAFLRQDAQLLVLDEPTAALDVQTEYDVYLRFHALTEGRTTLLISHRFSTVRMADRILYLEDGRITEEGTHAELIALGGEYARLYTLQAAQYAAGPSPTGAAPPMPAAAP